MKRWPASLPHPAFLFVAFAWGFNFVIIKLAYRGFEPAAVGVIRYLAMMALMFFLAHVMGQGMKPTWEERKRLLLGGFLGSGAYMVLFLEGMKRVEPAQGAVMLATAPIWISFFAILAKQERFRWLLLWGFLVAYVGVTVVILGGGGELGGEMLGIGLTLLSAMVWGLSVVVMNPALKDRPPMGAFAHSLPGAAVVLLPWGFWSAVNVDFAAVPPEAWFGLGYLILVAGTMAFVAYYMALKAMGPAQAGLMQYLVPVVACFAQWLILGQPITGIQVLGIIVVIMGVALARWKPREKVDPAAGVGDGIA